MIQPRIYTERATWVRNPLTRLFIAAGVIGSILSILVITLDGLLRPGYSPLYQMISDLLAGVGITNDGFFTEYNVADPHAALHDALHTRCRSFSYHTPFQCMECR